jgi:hypothetical protein
VEAHADHELWATKTGQVATSLNARDLHEIILDRLKERRLEGNTATLRKELGRLVGMRAEGAPAVRILGEKMEGSVLVQQIAVSTDRGLEISGDLLFTSHSGRRPAVLVVHTGKTVPSLAHRLARQGNVVLAIKPRGFPLTTEPRLLLGDVVSYHRAMLIGLSLPGMRALDILRAFDLLAAREDVDPARISAVANGTAGMWLLMAAAIEPRFAKLWLDGTPPSLSSAMEVPLHRNLHDAVLPGFLLHWDIKDIAKLAGGTKILWTDPANWNGQTVPVTGPFAYRTFEEQDERFVKDFVP